MPRIEDAKIAILATDGYERSELRAPLGRAARQGRDGRCDLAESRRRSAAGTRRTGATASRSTAGWGTSTPLTMMRWSCRAARSTRIVLRLEPQAIKLIKDFVAERQDRRRDLPRTVAAGRGGRAARPQGDVLSVDPHGRRECRWQLARRGSGGRSGDRHLAQSRTTCRRSSPRSSRRSRRAATSGQPDALRSRRRQAGGTLAPVRRRTGRRSPRSSSR